MDKKQLITIAGSVWCAVGAFLIIRGYFLYQLADSSKNTIIISLIVALVIGGAKGKFVLSKTARKNKNRIEGLEHSPLKIHDVFSKVFYFLIIGMIGLGVALRTYPHLVGGYVVVAAIYCGIGMALIMGSLVYWKSDVKPVLEEAS